MPLKHTSIPAGVDQPGFTGVTPSSWGQAHTFSGGTNGAVVLYNTGNSDNLGYAASAAGLLVSTGTNVLPTFTSTISIPILFTSYVQFSANYGGAVQAGSIFKHSNNGLMLTGVTGAAFDFAITNPSGASGVLIVPTGTLNITLGGVITGTGIGTSVIGGGGTSANSSLAINGGDTTARGAYIQFQKNGAKTLFVGHKSAIIGSGTADTLVLFAPALTGMEFYVAGSGSPSWGIDSSSNFTFGASNHPALSSGTPSVASGASAITGNDYAFTVTADNSAANIVVNFGHTFSSNPIAVATYGSTVGSPAVLHVTCSTTQLTLPFAAWSNTQTINVHVFGV